MSLKFSDFDEFSDSALSAKDVAEDTAESHSKFTLEFIMTKNSLRKYAKLTIKQQKQYSQDDKHLIHS